MKTPKKYKLGEDGFPWKLNFYESSSQLAPAAVVLERMDLDVSKEPSYIKDGVAWMLNHPHDLLLAMQDVENWLRPPADAGNTSAKQILDTIQKANPKRQEKYIRTHEDWYPTLSPNMKSPNPGGAFNNPLDVPAAYVMMNRLMGGEWRVAVWGADDFGLEHDGTSRSEAQALYDSIVDYTCQAQLKAMGFVNA